MQPASVIGNPLLLIPTTRAETLVPRLGFRRCTSQNFTNNTLGTIIALSGGGGGEGGDAGDTDAQVRIKQNSADNALEHHRRVACAAQAVLKPHTYWSSVVCVAKVEIWHSADDVTACNTTERERIVYIMCPLKAVERSIRSGNLQALFSPLLEVNRPKISRECSCKPAAWLLVLQVAEGAKIIAARMPEPFDVRKGHEETFKKVSCCLVLKINAQERHREGRENVKEGAASTDARRIFNINRFRNCHHSGGLSKLQLMIIAALQD